MHKKLNKYIEYGLTKLKTYIREKKYYSEGQEIKYMLEKNANSNELVIIFSGYTRIGLPARYNYNRTLKDIKVNKLFILDNFGYDGRGAYYLGKDLDFKIEKTVKDLIGKVKKDLSINKTFYVGSSKGGYAALYFGLEENDSIIISGAPQYKLGNYLNGTDYLRDNALRYIAGKELNESKVVTINSLLKEKIRNNNTKNHNIYLHYSSKERTFERHIKYMLEDLNEFGYRPHLDEHHYTDHNDVSMHFPSFLSGKIKENL